MSEGGWVFGECGLEEAALELEDWGRVCEVICSDAGSWGLTFTLSLDYRLSTN